MKKKCDICEKGEKSYADWERKCMKKEGWFAHLVQDDSAMPFNYNYHTHGTETSFQIVLPLPFQAAHSIVGGLMDRMKEGEKFESGDILEQVIGNGLKVILVEATECDRKVLRIVFPDKQGKFDKNDMEEKFAKQYQGI